MTRVDYPQGVGSAQLLWSQWLSGFRMVRRESEAKLCLRLHTSACGPQAANPAQLLQPQWASGLRMSRRGLELKLNRDWLTARSTARIAIPAQLLWSQWLSGFRMVRRESGAKLCLRLQIGQRQLRLPRRPTSTRRCSGKRPSSATRRSSATPFGDRSTHSSAPCSSRSRAADAADASPSAVDSRLHVRKARAADVQQRSRRSLGSHAAGAATQHGQPRSTNQRVTTHTSEHQLNYSSLEFQRPSSLDV